MKVNKILSILAITAIILQGNLVTEARGAITGTSSVISTSVAVNTANLVSDFGAQGNNGWNYGYGTSNADFVVATGYDATLKKYYQSGYDGLEIKSDFVHPAANKGAIYRWTVASDGYIDLSGKYTKFAQHDSNPSWPDGVKLTIYCNNQKLQDDVVSVSNSVDTTKDINIKSLNVKQGDNIYFIITANSNNAWDGGKFDVSINTSSVVINATDIFPKSQQSAQSYIGDVMPFYDNGKFNVFYLDDMRDVIQTGFHPWSLITTDNLTNYKNEGIVINHSNNTADQDLALGTGSVIKGSNGLYHAFFTGFNDRRSADQPHEAVMHATSTDLKNWTKIPGDTIFAPAEYSKDNFRDPYVFYNAADGKYWMLITSRDSSKGVIVRYTSTDLKVWTKVGTLFANDTDTTNLECSEMFQLGTKWYLTFSDQSDANPFGKRVVHYRVASNPAGPFTKLTWDDSFDGNGLYAGRFEKDASGNVYMFGWNGTKANGIDSNGYDWAGNLVVNQIKQDANGGLHAVPATQVVNSLSNVTNLTNGTNKIGTVNQVNNNYSFSGSGYQSVTLGTISGENKITGTINTAATNTNFGFMFNVGTSGKGSLNILFNRSLGRLEFYNASTDGSLGQLQSTKPLTISDNSALKFTIVMDDSVAVLYVNDEVAFTTRMYGMQNHNWGVFSNNSAVTFSNLQLSK